MIPILASAASRAARIRRAWRGALLLAAVALAACAAPLPEVVWLRLPIQAVRPPAPGGPTGDTWQLLPVHLPGHVDRDALMLPSDAGRRGAVLRASGHLRWAEPLRDAVPRLLRVDLERALAAPVWQAPLPPGVTPTRQLRIEVFAFDVQPEASALVLQARFSLADIDARRAPRVGEAMLRVPLEGAGAEALAWAHRQALAMLAGHIADAARAPR